MSAVSEANSENTTKKSRVTPAKELTKIAVLTALMLVSAFFKIRGFKIASLDEYWADDGDAPEWRRHMHIGKPII